MASKSVYVALCSELKIYAECAEPFILLPYLISDVVLYLQTVLVTESLSERAEMQRRQLLEKLSNRGISPAPYPYMDMNGRSKGKRLACIFFFFFLYHRYLRNTSVCNFCKFQNPK